MPTLFLFVITMMAVRGPEVSHAIQPSHRAPAGKIDGSTGSNSTYLQVQASDSTVTNMVHDREGTAKPQTTEFKRKVAAKLKDRKAKKPKPEAASSKSSDGADQKTALLLAILLGGLGIHRFYLGYYAIGVVQLLTGGGCGIWAFIDQVRIVTGQLQPKDGYYETTL